MYVTYQELTGDKACQRVQNSNAASLLGIGSTLVCVCEPRTQEAKAGGLHAESQLGLQSEATLKSQTKIPKEEAELTEA